ncbi:MAG: aminopeptidase [Candidatus Woesearchaeota archaeon]
MTQNTYANWAHTLMHHSIGNQLHNQSKSLEDARILIQGETISEPLMLAVEEAAVKAGARPLVLPFFSNCNRRNPFISKSVLDFGERNSFKGYLPESITALYKEMDGFVTILGTQNPFVYKNNIKGAKKIREVALPLTNIRTTESAWVLTKFPTPAEAALEQLDFETYAQLLQSASCVDYDAMRDSQKDLATLLDATSEIELRTYNPKTNNILSLGMQKGMNTAKNCFGLRNVPDGEVFTSPYPQSIEGEIYLDVPIINVDIIQGVYLKFQNGKIVSYSADVGQKQLQTIVETDEGSHSLGEFALGTNVKVPSGLKEILFAEKIGGSIHLAIGSSYDEPYPTLQGLSTEEKDVERKKLVTGGLYNESAQHVDIPKSFIGAKPDEGVFFDGQRISWKGDRWDY